MKKLLCIILSAVMIFTLGGCYDSKEISRIAFIIAVGFDEDSYTFQIVKPSEFEGESSEDSPLLTTTVNAPNVYIAMDRLNSSISEKCDYSHIKMVIFSQDKLTTGIEDDIYAMLNSNDFHPNTRVAMCKGKASEYMEDMKIPLDANPAEYYENIFKENYTEYAPDITIKDMQKNYKSQIIGNVLPVMSSTNSGMAITRDYKLTDTAGSDEVFVYNLLQWKNFNGNYAVDDNVVININKKNKRYNINLSGNTPIITIKLDLTGNVIWSPTSVDKEKISKKAEQKLENDITEFLYRCSLQYKSDIFEFYKLARTNYPTIQSWEKEDWQGLFQKANYKVTVKINIVKEQ